MMTIKHLNLSARTRRPFADAAHAASAERTLSHTLVSIATHPWQIHSAERARAPHTWRDASQLQKNDSSELVAELSDTTDTAPHELLRP